jgi:hypothetical protein
LVLVVPVVVAALLVVLSEELLVVSVREPPISPALTLSRPLPTMLKADGELDSMVLLICKGTVPATFLVLVSP